MSQGPPAAGSVNRRIRWQWMILGIPMVFLSASCLRAQEWWDKSPYNEWPGSRVYELLTESPWAVRTPAGFRQGETRIFNNGVMSRHSGYSISCYYLVRIVTAKPIREAMLRAISLQGKLLNVSSRMGNNYLSAKAAQEQERLESFIESRPDDLRVKGDQNQIIIAVTLKVNDRDKWREEDSAVELSNIDVSKVTQDTTLTTDAGRCAPLSFFKLAGADRLGVKFYFPRILPDGLPLISAGDKELRFTTWMNGVPIKVKFNLKKMRYQGKLEH